MLPACWQQRDEADFIRALNSRQETFAGISYTSVYTRTDETVKPNQDTKTGSSSLRTGDGMRTNVATQDICPTAVYEHLLIGTIDPVAYALAIDALALVLAHPGPADAARVSRLVCAQLLHPGINSVTGPADGAAGSLFVSVLQGADRHRRARPRVLHRHRRADRRAAGPVRPASPRLGS